MTGLLCAIGASDAVAAEGVAHGGRGRVLRWGFVVVSGIASGGAAVITGAGTASSTEASTVQRPSPESST